METNRPKLSQNALARALGLSAASVTKHKKMGMPVDSVEAATQWRNQNLRHDLRKRPAPNLPATSTRQEVEALALLALNALQLGEFALIAPACGLSCVPFQPTTGSKWAYPWRCGTP